MVSSKAKDAKRQRKKDESIKVDICIKNNLQGNHNLLFHDMYVHFYIYFLLHVLLKKDWKPKGLGYFDSAIWDKIEVLDSWPKTECE